MCNKILFSICLSLSLTFAASHVYAAQIRASGNVNIPSAQHADFDNEEALPPDEFTRSIVEIARAGTDFAYSGSADIGLLELKAFGQLTNSGTGSIGDIEIGVLGANALLRDTLTFESASTEDYDVVFDLQVDGLLEFDGGSGRAQASLNTGVFGSQNDSVILRNSGIVDETLSVTRTFNGTAEVDLFVSLVVQILSVDAGQTLTGQLNNTATLTITLPQGVSLAGSESGTFNQAITVVPLPGALPLFAAALFGWLGVGARRRH